MSDSWNRAVDSLDEPIPSTRSDKPRETYPCGVCAGTGIWKGGTNRHGNNKCHPCKGKGYFLTPPDQRRKTSRQRREAKNARQAEFLHAHNETVTVIGKAAEWSDFARSLMDVFNVPGRVWTDKQLAAAENMVAKIEARAAERAERQAKEATAVDLSPIVSMFEAASESGYKRPKYRAEGLLLSRAGPTSRNYGAIYVKEIESDEYCGKVMAGTFHPVRGKQATAEKLHAIAADPRGAAVRYGQRTGSCSCCGRTLTNGASIEAGIGPICAEKWGL